MPSTFLNRYMCYRAGVFYVISLRTKRKQKQKPAAPFQSLHYTLQIDKFNLKIDKSIFSELFDNKI